MGTNRYGKCRCEYSRDGAGTGSLGGRCSGDYRESTALLDLFPFEDFPNFVKLMCAATDRYRDKREFRWDICLF